MWGISLWIGGGWCHVDSAQMPFVANMGGGQGVNAQRTNLPEVSDQRPHVKSRFLGGSGVSAQRTFERDQIPHVHDRLGGQGVAKQRTNLPEVSDQRPRSSPTGGGQGVSAQRATRPNWSAGSANYKTASKPLSYSTAAGSQHSPRPCCSIRGQVRNRLSASFSTHHI